MTYELIAFATTDPLGDIRYRVYTTNVRKAAAFSKIPRIQFSDSGHGIVFEFRVLKFNERRKPVIRLIESYVRSELANQHTSRALDCT
jgi:hypothetical protein